jgi:hypothetical protein
MSTLFNLGRKRSLREKERTSDKRYGIPQATSLGNLKDLARSKDSLSTTVESLELPDKDTLDKLFEDVLSSMALPESKMIIMRTMPDDRKWTLVQQHQVKLVLYFKKSRTL